MEQFTGQLVMLLLGTILFCVSRGVYCIVYRSLADTPGWKENGAWRSAPGGEFARRQLSECMENEQRE